MPVVNSDALLWFNVGEFGRAGYAVPNCGSNPVSLNMQIPQLVDLFGQELFTICHHEDAQLKVPPSINTLMRVHKLYNRAVQILAGRAIAPSKLNMEPDHVQPAGEVFKVYPHPYFSLRNPFLKRWAYLVDIAISEAMQHTENRKAIEISTDFAGQIGQYFARLYQNMAIELFNKTQDQVSDPAFRLVDSDFQSYNPSAFFTTTETTDTVAPFGFVFTETMLAPLASGILVTDLPDLQPYPGNPILAANIARQAAMAQVADLEKGAGTSGTASKDSPAPVPVLPPAPTP